MLKKIILYVVLVGAGLLIGKLLFGSGSEDAVMPLSDQLYRSGSGSGSLNSDASGEFTGTIHEIKDGQSIQDAVREAQPGDLIRVYPGT